MIANAISILLHPIWMPTVLFGLLFFFVPTLAQPLSEKGVLLVMVAIFVTTCFFPLLSIWFFKFSGAISSYKMENGHERLSPFLAVSVFYGVTTYMLAYKLKMNAEVVSVMGTVAVLTFLVTLITRFYRISAHSAALTGILGILLALNYKLPQYDLYYPFMAMLLLAGLAMSCRLYLDAHKPEEVYWGAALGFAFSFLAIFILV
jgi:hypothetical protein